MAAPENATYAYVGALIDELVRSGVRHLCLCPGSRSTPIAISAARHPEMRVWTLIDERSAAFFALGLARGTRAPVGLVSTSGTAAANFFPAVIEARYGRTPLVVLTADRPHELRDSGANQTIDQIRLYGAHVRWFVEMAPPEATDAALRAARTIACQAVAAAQDGPAGPVHLNVPLREPLVPVPGEMPPVEERAPDIWEGRDRGRPFAWTSPSLRAPAPDVVRALAAGLRSARRGLIVCGPQDDAAFPDSVTRLAAALQFPVLADPLSQVRCGAHDRSLVVDAYDAMLRARPLVETLAPEVILRFGATPASRPLAEYLTRYAAVRQIVVDESPIWNDPQRAATDAVLADGRLACDALLAAAGRPADAASNAAGREWAGIWRRLGARARQAVHDRLAMINEPFEGKVFAQLSEVLPDGAILYVGNSMPVRDLDAFFPGRVGCIRILGNRGASGIDGLVSSALGVAAAGDGPVVLVLGDLAFYHDMNGLLAAKLHRLAATIVILNNDGGGIFSFLPQAAYREHFETLFGTPTGLDFRHAAEMYDATFARVDGWAAFDGAVRRAVASAGLDIVEMRTDRARNVDLHREVWAAVEEEVRYSCP